MAPTATAPRTAPPTTGFTLDVTVIEQRDSAGLVNLTNDGCGSTCGACVTNAG